MLKPLSFCDRLYKFISLFSSPGERTSLFDFEQILMLWLIGIAEDSLRFWGGECFQGKHMISMFYIDFFFAFFMQLLSYCAPTFQTVQPFWCDESNWSFKNKLVSNWLSNLIDRFSRTLQAHSSHFKFDRQMTWEKKCVQVVFMPPGKHKFLTSIQEIVR